MWNRGHSGQHLLQVVAGGSSTIPLPFSCPISIAAVAAGQCLTLAFAARSSRLACADGPLIAVGARLAREMAARALLSGLSELAHDCANRHGQSGSVHLGGGRRVGQRTEWNPTAGAEGNGGLLSGHRDIGSGACRSESGLKTQRILCWARPAPT